MHTHAERGDDQAAATVLRATGPASSRLKPVPLKATRTLVGPASGDAERHRMHTHAERGDDQASTTVLRATGPASSRLKPVPLKATRTLVGPASAGKLLLLIFIQKESRRHQSRLGCRLNGGLVEWAEPHGCGESAVRTWMSVRRGPTERGRSEGTPTKEGPNREQAPLVTWGAFPSNSPKAKPKAVRPKLLIFTAQAQRNTSPATRCPNMSQHRKQIQPPCR
jgi:hypothetical protein